MSPGDTLVSDVTQRPWVCRKQVLPQHTDHAGVLWHGAYVAWLEEARVEALDAAGLAYAELSDQGLELMVVQLDLSYRRPLRLGECAELRSWLKPTQGVRHPFYTEFIAADGSLAAIGIVTLALVDRGRGRVQRQQPAKLAAALESLRCGPRLI